LTLASIKNLNLTLNDERLIWRLTKYTINTDEIKMLAINNQLFSKNQPIQTKNNIDDEMLESTIGRCDYYAALNLLLAEIMNERSAGEYSGTAYRRLNSLCHSNGGDYRLIEALEGVGNDADNPGYQVALGTLCTLYSGERFAYLIDADHERASGYLRQLDTIRVINESKALIKDCKYDEVMELLLRRAEHGDNRATEALDTICVEQPFASPKLYSVLLSALTDGPRTVTFLLDKHFGYMHSSLYVGAFVRLANQVNNKDECWVQALTNLCTTHNLLVDRDPSLANNFSPLTYINLEEARGRLVQDGPYFQVKS
jgi:hypothetical protein